MLTKGQVHHINRIIQKRRLNSFLLEEEVVDFVSCAVEDLIQQGEPFDAALATVLADLDTERINRVHQSNLIINKPSSMDLFKNYLLIAQRNFVKHKVNSAVNIAGLLLALVSVLIIGLYVTNELSYDRSIPDAERVYRVNGTSFMGDVPSSANYVSPLLVEAMLEEIPEVTHAASGLSLYVNKPLKILDKNFFDIRIDYFRKDVFEIFCLDVKAGSLESTYDQPYGVMVSASFARQVFGEKNPINETIEAEIRGKKITFTIGGVFEDKPQNSHLRYARNPMEVIASQKAWELIGGYKGAWNSTHMPAYVKLKAGSDPAEVDKKLGALLKRRAGEDIFYEHYLQPVWDIHLNTLGLPTSSVGDYNQVLTFALIGLLILAIACINYINLTTARVTIRMKEVGVRKVLGAGKSQFLYQFIVEAFLVTMLSMIISFGFVALSLDYVNSTFDLNLSLALFENGLLLGGMFIILLLISLLSGGYPGFYLSKIASTNLLKSTLSVGNRKFSVRKLLVVFQFGISAAIVTCTIVVLNQLNFLSQSDLGYDQESIVYIPLPGAEIKSKGPVFKESLNRLPVVKSTALTKGSVAKGNFSGNRIKIGNDEGSMQRIMPVDFKFNTTMGISLTEGRWFDQEMATDIEQGFVVNEAFLKYFDLQDPIGTKIARNDQKGEIIGVAKDFHWKSMHDEIEPLVMFMQKDYARRYGNIVVKLQPGNLKVAHDQLETAWQEIFGDRPFEWEFLDEQLAMAYRKDEVFGDIFSSFSAITIIISCLGLLGLVSFSVERRLREIGVRKVLGASVTNILLLVSKDFSKLVLIGFALSIPAAWFFMDQWLEGFKYRIELDYMPFLVTCLAIVLIAWGSVSWISLKAARSNPVDSLRSE